MYYPRVYLVPVLLSLAGYGQTPGEQPAFEAASIRQAIYDPAKGVMVRAMGGPGSKDPTRFTAQNFSLSNLLAQAYAISFWQLSAPELDRSREMFDVSAVMPEGTTKEQFQLMLQRLLAERFGLRVHWDNKEMPLYELVVAKNGPKFKGSTTAKAEEPAPDKPLPLGPLKLGADGYPRLAPGRSGTMMMNGKARMQFIDEPMSRLVASLSGAVRGPVQDATGLTEKYDLTLFWSTSDSAGRAAPPISSAGGGPVIDVDASSGPTIFEALKDQLGLMLEKKKGPVKVLVVDHFNKLPTEN